MDFLHLYSSYAVEIQNLHCILIWNNHIEENRTFYTFGTGKKKLKNKFPNILQKVSLKNSAIG